jgi:dTDP-4-dehydrorhamnose reductase
MLNVIKDFKPEAVINAVGIIKQRDDTKAYIPNIEINALMPHKLSQLCAGAGARLIHMSTDCVFSGNKGNYSENDSSDPCDLYGQCKYMGEVSDEHCITFRTSIIGMELLHKKSLIEWFLSQKGSIQGFRKAIYTGLTTMEMARVIEYVLVEHADLSGVYHLASKPISKYMLLKLLTVQLNRTEITVAADDTFICDRSLSAEKFKMDTGYEVPSWEKMIYELANIINIREKGVSI